MEGRMDGGRDGGGGREGVRDRNKETILLVHWTSDHVRLTCPPIFSYAKVGRSGYRKFASY